MKKIYRLTIFTGLLLINLLTFSQPPPPPNNPTLIGENAPVGGGAPIGSGTMLLVGLAVAYAGRKIYVLHSETEDEDSTNP